MKKLNLIVTTLLLLKGGDFFAAENNVNLLSSEMESSYASQFYPGVVKYAGELLKEDITALTAQRACVYSGESLFKMGRVAQAQETLESKPVNTASAESIYLSAGRQFWLGRCFFEQEKFEEAARYFYSSAELFKKTKKTAEKTGNDYFSLSMLWGSRSFLKLDRAGDALPLMEYVISRGKSFTQQDYEETALNLCSAYNRQKDFSKTEKLCQTLLGADFSTDFKGQLLLIYGDTLYGNKNYLRSYEVYCQVLESYPSYLAVRGMQKAYEVSSLHRKEVGEDAGSVLSKAESRLSEYPELLGEFWTRLAVDAYGDGENKKALSYFNQGSECADLDQKTIAAVYKAQIAWEENKNKTGIKNALNILEEAEKTGAAAGTVKADLLDSLKLSKARFYGYDKSWQECERLCAGLIASVNDSSDAEILRQSYYWYSLSLYEQGKIKESIKVLQDYSEKRSQALTVEKDSSMLNLYARALAKNENYSQADQIFYSLEQAKKLNNDGILDYTRTLLKGGYFISTKEQASMAEGDEGIYLSALASFNQRNWGEAAAGFARVKNSLTLGKNYRAYSNFYLGYCFYQKGEYEKAEGVLSGFIQNNPEHPLYWSGLITSAKSASFCKKYEKACEYSQLAVKTAKNQKNREEAVFLLAGSFADAGKTDDAVKILEPYSEEKNLFGYECKFKKAELLVLKKDFDGAEECYSELAKLTVKEAVTIAEDSAYRMGEINYSREQYSRALTAFERYLKKFPEGRFSLAAVYFSADCLSKTGAKSRAVLRYLQIVDSDKKTTYRYGAEKSLVFLYEELGEYSNAVKMAENMLKEYGQQARDDGIEEKIKALAQKKVQTAEKTSSGNKKLDTAVELRNSGKFKEAARAFLDACVQEREKGNDKAASRCLYGAVEAFDAAGLTGDAKATLSEMKKLYPDDEYTKEAERLVE